MAIGAQFNAVCTIQRQSSVPDAYGQRKATWHTHAEQVRCRLVTRTQQAPLSELAERPISTRYTLLVAGGSDVRVTDRIVSVCFDDGSSDAGPFQVASVMPRRQAKRGILHISAELERVGK
jgi:hypothetical protein